MFAVFRPRGQICCLPLERGEARQSSGLKHDRLASFTQRPCSNRDFLVRTATLCRDKCRLHSNWRHLGASCEDGPTGWPLPSSGLKYAHILATVLTSPYRCDSDTMRWLRSCATLPVGFSDVATRARQGTTRWHEPGKRSAR
jgi:hypothetical protein